MPKSEIHALLSGDPAEAAPWVRLAASHGLTEAQVRLGRMLLDGTGLPKDETAALGWFKTAARSGDADAMNMAGRCHENGWGTAKDATVAAEWYRRSAEAGHAWGEYNYANMLFDGIGVAIDPPQALLWYLKAARRGHSRAMNQAARCYEEGWGAAKDHAAATEYYRLSAESGYFRGQYNYATLCAANGRIDEAIRWFKQAAETGTIDIRRRIAQDLLARDEAAFYPAGTRILALCCESGDAADFYRYGRALLHGFRCRPDENAGMTWLRRAADLDHEGAAAELIRTERRTTAPVI